MSCPAPPYVFSGPGYALGMWRETSGAANVLVWTDPYKPPLTFDMGSFFPVGYVDRAGLVGQGRRDREHVSIVVPAGASVSEGVRSPKGWLASECVGDRGLTVCEADGPPRCLVLAKVPEWREVSRVTVQPDTGRAYARIGGDGRIVVLAVRMWSTSRERPCYAWVLQPPDYDWVSLALQGEPAQLIGVEGDRVYLIEDEYTEQLGPRVEETRLTEWRIAPSTAGLHGSRQKTLLAARWLVGSK